MGRNDLALPEAARPMANRDFGVLINRQTGAAGDALGRKNIG